MIYVFMDAQGQPNGNIHYQPLHSDFGIAKSREELEAMTDGKVFDELPKQDDVVGKIAILKYDGEKLYYEYQERGLTDVERLQQENSNLQIALVELSAVQQQITINTQIALAELAAIISTPPSEPLQPLEPPTTTEEGGETV